MCWSWQVSLVFSSLQFAAICYLLQRNRYLDRVFVLLQLPIALQELFQFMLWFWAIDVNTSENNCSKLNHSLSYLILVTVLTIPPLHAYVIWKYSYYDNTNCSDEKRLYNCYRICTRKICFKFHFYYQCIFYFVWIFICIWFDYYYSSSNSLNGGGSFCTYVSKSGHQVWALNKLPGMPLIYRKFSSFLYLLVIVVIMFARPLWLYAPPAIFSFVSALILRYIYMQESSWGSIWCWFCSFLAIWWLCTPFVAHIVITRYKNIDANFHGCCAFCCFKGTKQTFELKIASNKIV